MSKWTLNLGAHLVADRAFYEHHGIYIGNDEVIHYPGKNGYFQKGAIEITDIYSFIGVSRFSVRPFGKGAFEPEDIVSRAYSRVGEDKYHLLFNNCEAFANWCIYGEHKSLQVTYITEMTTVILPTQLIKSTNKLLAYPVSYGVFLGSRLYK